MFSLLFELPIHNILPVLSRGISEMTLNKTEIRPELAP